MNMNRRQTLGALFSGMIAGPKAVKDVIANARIPSTNVPKYLHDYGIEKFPDTGRAEKLSDILALQSDEQFVTKKFGLSPYQLEEWQRDAEECARATSYHHCPDIDCLKSISAGKKLQMRKEYFLEKRVRRWAISFKIRELSKRRSDIVDRYFSRLMRKAGITTADQVDTVSGQELNAFHAQTRGYRF